MKSLGRILAISLLLIPFSVMAAAQEVGEFIVAHGGVELHSKADGSLHKPQVGDKVYLNDRILTKENGFAKILLKDKSILRVSPSSQLTISITLVGTQGHNTTIDLLRGKLRALVVEKLGSASKYEVHTSVAVAGVRGTDFEVLAQGKNTTVRCFTGHVWISNINSSVKGGVVLGPNTYTKISAGMPPLEPLPIPPGYSDLRGDLSNSNGNSGIDQSDIQDIVTNITNQTLDGIVDDSLADSQNNNHNLDVILNSPINGNHLDGQINQVPDTGSVQVPFTISIPTP